MQTKKAVIHKDTGQLIADSTVNQCGCHGRINTAGKTENHFVLSDLMADSLHSFLGEITHDPVRIGFANLKNKGFKDFTALLGMRDFRMELNSVETSLLISHAGDGASRSRAHQFEARRHFSDFVAVAHPNFQIALAVLIGEVGDVFQEFGVAVLTNFCVTELTLSAAFNLAAELLSHCLHAIANT